MSNTRLAVAITAALLLAGCAPKKATSTASKEPTSLSAHGHEITRDSAPAEVAQLLIDALEKSDNATLAKLVASQHSQSDTARITQGRKEFQTVVDNADALAVVGWKLKFATLKPATAKVASHSVEGEQAIVQIEAVNKQDVPVTLTATLVREDGWWKVMPGVK